MPFQQKCLIIGYGNELRGDDAVGPIVARAMDNLKLPGVQVIIQHQLTPELVEPMSQARQVLFIDASVEPSSLLVMVRPIKPADSATLMAHTGDPRSLIALALAVYGQVPPSWWITIPITNTHYGESLSAIAQKGASEALNQVQKLLRNDECLMNKGTCPM
jgi:hydrogenase maturation protease